MRWSKDFEFNMPGHKFDDMGLLKVKVKCEVKDCRTETTMIIDAGAIESRGYEGGDFLYKGKCPWCETPYIKMSAKAIKVWASDTKHSIKWFKLSAEENYMWDEMKEVYDK